MKYWVPYGNLLPFFLTEKTLVIPIWKGKGNCRDCNNYHGIMLLSVPGKELAHLLLIQICIQLLKLQKPKQSGFMWETDYTLAFTWWNTNMSFDQESLWPMLISRRHLIHCITTHSGISCDSKEFMQWLLVCWHASILGQTESALKCVSGLSSFFSMNTRMELGFVFAPPLFNTCGGLGTIVGPMRADRNFPSWSNSQTWCHCLSDNPHCSLAIFTRPKLQQFCLPRHSLLSLTL